MKRGEQYVSQMSIDDLPAAEGESEATHPEEGDEEHPLKVGLDAAERGDTAGLDDILDDID